MLPLLWWEMWYLYVSSSRRMGPFPEVQWRLASAMASRTEYTSNPSQRKPIISRIEFAVVRMALLGRSQSKLMVLKNINNGQFPQSCHIHGLIKLPLHTRTVRTKRHRQGKAHLIGGAVAEHGDGHVLASPIKLHAAVLMVFCSQRETGANSALRCQDSVAAEEVGGSQIPDQSGEQHRSRKGCIRTCA